MEVETKKKKSSNAIYGGKSTAGRSHCSRKVSLAPPIESEEPNQQVNM